jgi:hypothetical protein
MRFRISFLLALSCHAQAQIPVDRLLDAVAASADLFHRQARNLVSRETLVQRCYRIPEHGHLAIGKGAEALRAQMVVTEVVSEYALSSLKNDRSGNLLEVREVLQKNDVALQTPAAARQALSGDISAGEEHIRKKLLAGFSQLGLLDVATDYGSILLAFTRSALPLLQLQPQGHRMFGAEDAFVFTWRQSEGGLLEFRGHKTARRPMHGELWVRLSDGSPARITAAVEHPEKDHILSDEASIDFAPSRAGCVTPVSVVHRHYVDRELLTENLYTYAPFERFSAETTIRFETAAPK